MKSVYPYWRANSDEPSSKKKEKPFEPRPLKYKENYEDKGLKVFKPDGFEPVIGTLTVSHTSQRRTLSPSKRKRAAQRRKNLTKMHLKNRKKIKNLRRRR